MKIVQRILAALPAIAIACAPAASLANVRTDHAALARVDGAYEAASKLAPGSARTQRLCVDAQALLNAAQALPVRAPAFVPVDDDTWNSARNPVLSQTSELIKLCAAPGHQRKEGRELRTADQVASVIDDAIESLRDVAKPRDIPLPMKTFRAAMTATKAGPRLCAQRTKLVALLSKMAPPTGADLGKWTAATDEVSAALEELRANGCSGGSPQIEGVGGALQELHARYFALVILVPPRS